MKGEEELVSPLVISFTFKHIAEDICTAINQNVGEEKQHWSIVSYALIIMGVGDYLSEPSEKGRTAFDARLICQPCNIWFYFSGTCRI